MGDFNVTTTQSSLTGVFINQSTQSSQTTSQFDLKGSNESLKAKADLYGIDVSSYTAIDAATGETIINTQALKLAVELEAKAKIQNTTEEDTFIKTSDGTTYTEEEAITESSSAKKSINLEYKSIISEYSNKLSDDEKQLAREWSSIKNEADELTSVTTSNTTILEGVKDFISTLTNLVKETKDKNASTSNNDKEDIEITSEEEQDKNIFAIDNDIQVYANYEDDVTLGNNPFFESALRTFEYDEEEAAV